MAVSVLLVQEEEGTQHPFYYVSKSLISAETRYSHLEKLTLALMDATRKLRPFFQCHPIVVITSYPLQNVLHKPELSGRMAKWAVEMSELDFEYKPRIAINYLAQADFIADFSRNMTPQVEKEAILATGHQPGMLTQFTDEASNKKGLGLGIILVTPNEEKLRQMISCILLTNNEAKYEAFFAILGLARSMGAEMVNVFCNSQLAINKIKGAFDAKDERMMKYTTKFHSHLSLFYK